LWWYHAISNKLFNHQSHNGKSFLREVNALVLSFKGYVKISVKAMGWGTTNNGGKNWVLHWKVTKQSVPCIVSKWGYPMNGTSSALSCKQSMFHPTPWTWLNANRRSWSWRRGNVYHSLSRILVPSMCSWTYTIQREPQYQPMIWCMNGKWAPREFVKC
jgi:hypothetical protein